ncbi:heparin-binding EGF-like growth factor b [Chanos chanos]|uniref:Proheparin-binding EGF-like growth factor n=1 Tax=Chanos chanos TaxID=29144 RepID=A0A6J2W2D7_CHACN|nr:proheparin-binding EGF-like growth factor [Chanos chanos]
MSYFTHLFLFSVCVLLFVGAKVEAYKAEKSRTTAINRFLGQDEERTTTDVQTPVYDDDYSYEGDDNDYDSGDYGLEFPRVAFSTKPKDPSVVPVTGGKRKGKRKGKKKNPCRRQYKGFCIHGVCHYMEELKAPSCRCKPGYSGERCHLVTLPVGKNEDSYSQTTALVIIAVVLSLLCFAVIGILLAFRYHKKRDYTLDNEEKVKLEMTSVQ